MRAVRSRARTNAVCAVVVAVTGLRVVAFASSPGRSSSKRCSANARKISPSTGSRYCTAVSVEFARSSSAAAQSRRSTSARSVMAEQSAASERTGG